MVQPIAEVDYSEYGPRIFGFQMTDIHERINMERMRKGRLERARRLMTEAGISVMLFLLSENMRYTIGYAWLGYTPSGAYVLLPVEGDPILFAHAESDLHEKQPGMMTWMKPENIRRGIIGVPDHKRRYMNDPQWKFLADQFADQIKAALEEMGLSKEELILDYNYSDAIEALESKGIRVAVNDRALEEAQTIKLPDEIECCRASSAICDLVHYELAKYAEPGKTERELSGYMNYMAMKYGAEPRPNCYVNTGQHTNHLYIYPTDKVAMIGDLMCADTISVKWCGYGSCSYRTYSIGAPPSQASIDTYKKQVDDMYDQISRIKPGNTTADVYPPGVEVPMGRIHGIGLAEYGPPYGMPGWPPEEFREGMVLTTAAHTPTPEGQGVAFEEHIVVTKTGCEVLTHYPHEIVVCPQR